MNQISSAGELTQPAERNLDRIDWIRGIPYFAVHAACLAVIWVGWSWLAVSMCAFLYAARVFALTGFYHRYFSHRTFKCWRGVQFFFAAVGCSAAQRGPLWWAAHHRHHHAHSDDPEDLHSPRQHGFLWAHMCWFLTPRSTPTNLKLIPDFARYPELRFLDKYDLLVPVLLGASLFGFGELVAWEAPSWGVNGWQMVVWFLISTVAVYHVTYLVNSATHVFGSRRYKTTDDSRNSLLIALLTFGEGWHNNHHYYPNSTRQGFFWWEIDISYYVLRFLSLLGLVWDLRPVPKRVLQAIPGDAPIPMDLATPTTVVS